MRLTGWGIWFTRCVLTLFRLRCKLEPEQRFEAFMRELEMRIYDAPSQSALSKSFPEFKNWCEKYLRDERKRSMVLGLPDISEIKIIQTALFDNWVDGKPKKNHPNRYGLSIEVWCGDDINVAKRGSCDVKATTSLHNKKDFLKVVKRVTSKNLKNPISDEYKEALIQLSSQFNDDMLAGLIYTKDPQGGTTYHNNQFVIVGEAGTPDTKILLHVNSKEIILNKFSKYIAGETQKLLVGPILQSRTDLGNIGTKWATEPWD